jgi:hypothetical protein
MKMAELEETWTKRAQMVKEEKLALGDAWTKLAEFLTLTSKQQQQWVVGQLICPKVTIATRAECLHKKLWQIAAGADTKREVKTRIVKIAQVCLYDHVRQKLQFCQDSQLDLYQ